MNKYLISVVGPTAIGKTALSIKLAQYFNTEIISADSRQFFREMQIGTAAPTKEDQLEAKHHFIHHKSVKDDYNVGAFEKDALQCLDLLFKSHNIAIMVGGSGLYVDAVIKGLDNFPKVNSKIREILNQEMQVKGITHLQERLKKLDVLAYNTIAIDNPRRLVRALEICTGTQKPYSSFLNREKVKRHFKIITIGLTANRDIIYNRINRRVDIMLKEGLLKEAESLFNLKHLNALNTVGYKEIFGYINNEWTLDFAVLEIKKNSRRFAKRQLTWFKKNKKTIWFNYLTNLDAIKEEINKNLNFKK